MIHFFSERGLFRGVSAYRNGVMDKSEAFKGPETNARSTR